LKSLETRPSVHSIVRRLVSPKSSPMVTALGFKVSM